MWNWRGRCMIWQGGWGHDCGGSLESSEWISWKAVALGLQGVVKSSSLGASCSLHGRTGTTFAEEVVA